MQRTKLKSWLKALFQRPFAKLGLFAIPLLFFVGLMAPYHPKTIPDQYSSFIVAFEFVQTPEGVEDLFGLLQDDKRKDMDIPYQKKIQRLDWVNYIDYGLMLSYSLFLFFFFIRSGRYFKMRWLSWGIWLSIFAFVYDALENVCLLDITREVRFENYEATWLYYLPFFTWGKWLALAVALGWAAVALLHGKGLMAKLTSFVLIIPLLLGMVASITQAAPMIDAFASSVFLGLGWLVVSCFWLR